MRDKDSNAETLALSALAWTLGDGDRAARLLALTGLTPEILRARIGEPSLLSAALGFLEAHEPDLVACAAALDVKPGELVQARTQLEL
jgi:hypothetical protein